LSELVRWRACTPDAESAPPMGCAHGPTVSPFARRRAARRTARWRASDGEPAHPTASPRIRRRARASDREPAHPIASPRIRSRARASDGEPTHSMASPRIRRRDGSPAVYALRSPLSCFAFRGSCSPEEPGSRSQSGELPRPRPSRFACGSPVCRRRARSGADARIGKPDEPGYGRMRPFVGRGAASQA
jgi:hypothetical protein